jgi:hypothetical protein
MRKLLWVTISSIILLFPLLIACSEKETSQENEISTTTATSKPKPTSEKSSTTTATSKPKPTSEKSSSETALRNLETIDDLKSKFNEDFGKTRLILLFSPT